MSAPLGLVAANGRVRIPVRVIPRSPKNRVDGIRAGRLLVRVTAPPVDSAANEAVLTVMADHFGIPRRSFEIVSGQTSRNKTIEITGLSELQVRARLAVD